MTISPVKSSNLWPASTDNANDYGTSEASEHTNSQEMILPKKKVSFMDDAMDSETHRAEALFPEAHSDVEMDSSDTFRALDHTGHEDSVLNEPDSNIAHAEKPRARDEVTQFAVSGPAEAYVRNIADKYPKAPQRLLERLGQANWERHVQVRMALENEPREDLIPSTAAEPTIFKPASFKDSGLGTSIMPAAMVDYEASVGTFASRLDDQDNYHFRVGRMPEEDELGRVLCPYCNRFIREIKSRGDWKRHVYEDIQPYICTISGCEASLSTFPSRTAWAQHEFQEHLLKSFWPCATCDKVYHTSDHLSRHQTQYQHMSPFSDEERLERAIRQLSCGLCNHTPQSARSYVSHVARHLESIALAALPNYSHDTDDEMSSNAEEKKAEDRPLSTESNDEDYVTKHDIDTPLSRPTELVYNPSPTNGISGARYGDTERLFSAPTKPSGDYGEISTNLGPSRTSNLIIGKRDRPHHLVREYEILRRRLGPQSKPESAGREATPPFTPPIFLTSESTYLSTDHGNSDNFGGYTASRDDIAPYSEDNESARDHWLYKEALPQKDGLFHCPWEGTLSCNHKPEYLKCNYDKFVDSHLKPYRCRENSCEDLRFSSTACLLRHEREAHSHGDKPYLCTVEACERAVTGNGFPRKWNLRDHMKRVHGIEPASVI